MTNQFSGVDHYGSHPNKDVHDIITECGYCITASHSVILLYIISIEKKKKKPKISSRRISYVLPVCMYVYANGIRRHFFFNLWSFVTVIKKVGTSIPTL